VRILSPNTLEESLGLLADTDQPIVPIAGGTDLMVSWHHHDKDDWTLMDLSRIAPELQNAELHEDHLELGGLTTYWDVIQSTEISAAFPLLPAAARQVGAIQIQTRGTWAGNIGNGSPAADGVPVMMAYEATVSLASSGGRRDVRLDEYYTGYRQSVRSPDELIVSIRMPRRDRHMEWFHKVGARAAQAITKVGVACVHDDVGWRVVANSVAPVVCRCRRLEAALEDSRSFSTPDDIRDLLDHDIAPIDDIRSTAEYRRSVLSRLLFYQLKQP
jgi:CO/xanthine dehydrogenase FAD-binding subunit